MFEEINFYPQDVLGVLSIEKLLYPFCLFGFKWEENVRIFFILEHLEYMYFLIKIIHIISPT